MAKEKTQKIVILLELISTDKNLIQHGIRIATVFKKELCLCYHATKNKNHDLESLETQVKSYVFPIKNDLPKLQTSTLVFTEKLAGLPDKLADDDEAILFIAGSSVFKKYANAFAESPVPFLFVNEKSDVVADYKKLILAIDTRKENSDSSLWASYFGRFNHAAIVTIAANHKNSQKQKQVATNLALAKKIFNKFNIEHKIFLGTKSSLHNAFEALDLALSSHSDLLIILGSSEETPVDKLIGLHENITIKKAGKLPVLLINPRRDNYILCD